MRVVGPAEIHWAQVLAGWAIPEEILAGAPESPWGFPPDFFRAPDVPQDSPSRRRALEALPPGGSVLDVGAGGGSAGLALVPPAVQLIAVDETPAMLAMVAEAAVALGAAVTTIEGRWPGVADRVPTAEVVVCHHVLYNAADLGEFVLALSAHATRRVVVEITELHPMVGLNLMWRHFHGLDRPTGPGVSEALEVLAGRDPSQGGALLATGPLAGSRHQPPGGLRPPPPVPDVRGRCGDRGPHGPGHRPPLHPSRLLVVGTLSSAHCT